ncbi:hypothetical protein ACTXG7_09060 [Mycolicibacterium sp. Dal123E01]|uniref:hypothetical protein n=1 Tax=Mycolicibacterium sp. Dal123E01 TaxID=3457578 RepID=UPI00403E6AF5
MLSDRFFAAVLVSITGLTLISLAMLVFGNGPLHSSAPMTRAVVVVMTIGGAGIAAAVLAGTVRESDFSVGTPAKVMSYLTRLLPLAGLIVLAVTILCMNEARRVSSRPEWIVIRAVLWTGLAVSCLYVLRPRKPRYLGSIDVDPMARVALPLMVMMVAVAVVPGIGFPPGVISILLLPPSNLIGIAVYPIFLGLFFMAAIKGLSESRDRGERLSRYLGDGNGRVSLLLVGKLIALLGFCVVLHVMNEDSSPFSWTLSAWAFAVGAAVIAIFLFVVDDRVSLSKADYHAVAQNTVFVIPGFVGLTFAMALAFGLALGFAMTRPFALVAVLVIVALALLPRHVVMAPLWRTFHRGALVVAVIGAIVVGASPPFFGAVYSGADRDSLVLLEIGVLVAILATIGGLGWVIVRSFRKRQFGLATYLLTVVAWIALIQAWSTTAAPIRWTQFDLVLTGFMIVLTGASMLGLRHAVDPIEIVVAATVTFFLIEYSSMSNLLPRYVKALPIVFAVVAPGLIAIWRGLDRLTQHADHRKAMVQLATTAMVYAGVVAFVVGNKMEVGRLVDNISNVTLGFISIPLVLLLIAARQPPAGRHTAVAHAQS